MTITYHHKSLTFHQDELLMGINLTYSSLHALTVNSQLPVFTAWFLALESISIKQLVSGFTDLNIFAECLCQCFCFVPCLEHILPCPFICIIRVTFLIMMLHQLIFMLTCVTAMYVHCNCFSFCTAKKSLIQTEFENLIILSENNLPIE